MLSAVLSSAIAAPEKNSGRATVKNKNGLNIFLPRIRDNNLTTYFSKSFQQRKVNFGNYIPAKSAVTEPLAQ